MTTFSFARSGSRTTICAAIMLSDMGEPAFAQQGVQSKAPAPIGTLGGVRSQPARMISPGGQGGIPLYRTNTLLPPDQAQFRPRVTTPIAAQQPLVGSGPRVLGAVPAGTGGGQYFNFGDRGEGGGGGVAASSAASAAANSSWWAHNNNCYTGGTTISGAYTGDKWNIRFRLGSVLNGNCHQPCYPSSNCYRFPLSWYYNNYWRGDNSYSQLVYSGPWYGTDPFVTQGQTPAQTQAAAQAAATERELTPVEKAEVSWRAGQNSESIRWFREHLDREPLDADAMRYLALVLIDDRKIEQAVALMSMAYEKNPKLASKPLPVDILPGGIDAQRRRVNVASTYANRVKTGSAWLTLAVLMQSEGRDDVAAKIVDRAKASGGNVAVLDELALSLKN